ncbi:hypothetical protein PCL_00762 [Purpureocillium lilacinum]|uniref:Glycoside hydrolase n=1 Tax=Purpureocillium lilacinum TaxID=33203 RepID=A0A179GIQ0_PURLI|nr:glycoside hydrolase [Purpureocillium lilacinum]PWI69850.1 hypothetical protein PCL_00762 [Purpureocillium lilacinum]
MFAKALIVGGLAMTATAHVKISNPVPFQKSQLTNAPLDASGKDFPCKVGGDHPYTYELEGASNVYAQGSTQQLAFVGSAVHGGGSCQVSITTDLKPTKSSKWKVIKSIIGGCPAQNQGGNMGDSASFVVPFKYDYEIPKELAAGNYTLAWTWFNKVGNREMYMNCAPLTVTGSAGSEAFMNTLPDMFTANIGTGCGTKEGADVVFPDPGKNVVFSNAATPTMTAAPTGSCPTGKAPAPYPTPAPSQAPSPSNVNNPVQQPSQPASKPGGVYITVSQQQPVATSAAPVASQPAATQPAAPSSVAPAPSAGNPGGNSPSGGHAQGAACTTEGAWNCIGGTSFQRCASGTWSAVQPMAAGVQCTAGESNNLETKAKMSKRNMRWARRFAA